MDDEDYGFEYSDDDQEEEDVNIENQYYNSKGLLESDVDAALAGFEEVVSMEEEKGEWGFKAYKQIVKLQFRRGRHGEMLAAYKRMLTYIKSAVTRNYSEKIINKVLDLVSGPQKMELLQELYETTLLALQEAKNERLWFKTNLKLGKLWYDLGEYTRLAKIVKELHRSCQGTDGGEDLKKGTQLLEVYALEIQMYTSTKNNKKLKCLYQKALQATAPPLHAAPPAHVGRSTRADQERDPAPEDHGRDPRVRRQDAHGRARVGEGTPRPVDPPLSLPPLRAATARRAARPRTRAVRAGA